MDFHFEYVTDSFYDNSISLEISPSKIHKNVYTNVDIKDNGKNGKDSRPRKFNLLNPHCQENSSSNQYPIDLKKETSYLLYPIEKTIES